MPVPAEVREGSLVERDAELFALGEVVAEVAANGHGRAVLIEGDAGIGKTSLLGALRVGAARAGYTVAGTTCGELETELSFGVIRELFGSIGADVTSELEASSRARYLDLPGPFAAGEPSPAAAFDALYWRCIELAESAPLLLLVDDVQWCDAPSARFIAYLLRRLEDVAVLVAIARRSGGPAPVADVASLIGATLTLRPPPLSPDGTRDLVRRTDPAMHDETCDAVHRATAGNPFLVLELAGAAAEDARPPHVGELGPGAAKHSILTRLERLGRDACAVARAVAVLGGQSLVRRVALLAQISEDRAIAAIDTLVDHGFLAAPPLSFAHPVVRTAVLEDIPPAALVAGHAEAARLLHRDGVDAAVVAAHLLEAEPGQGDWARNVLLAVGRAALGGGDFELAVRCADRALPAAPVERREEALAIRAGALCAAGAPDAEDVAMSAIDEVGAAARAELAIALAYRLILAGRAGAAGGLLDRVGAREGDRETALRLAAAAARAAAMAGDRDGLTRRLGAIDAAGLPGETRGERTVLQEAVFARLGEADDAAGLLDLARRAAGAWDDGEPATLPAFAIAVAGELDESIATHDRLIDAGRRRYGDAYASTIVADRAIALLQRGRIAEAQADAALAVRLSERDPAAAIATGWTRATLALATALAGDIVAGEGLLEAVPDHAPNDLPTAIVCEFRARVAAAAGRPEDAVAGLRQLGVWLEDQGIANPGWWSWRSAVARLLVGLGERAQARRLAEDELHDARRFGTPSAVGVALVAAGVAHDGGGGIAMLREGVRQLARSQARTAYADALLTLGSALCCAGAREEAREPLRDALDLAERGGIGLLAAAAEAELRATGARPRRRALTGAGSLTPAEHRVARLASDGLTNRQIARTLFVAPKTVETHLGHIYAKLDIPGRTALAGALGTTQGVGYTLWRNDPGRHER